MATKYWVGVSAAASNWNSTGPTPWSNTDGGANNATAPTATDDVVFNGNGAFGNSNNTISNTRTCLSLTVTAGYTGTRTHNAVLTVAGNVTFGANETIAGSSSMTISAASTITSNGKTWPNAMTWNNSHTTTLVGDLTVTGGITLGNGTFPINKTTAEVLYTGGLVTTGSGIIPDTSTITKIVLTGGTWNGGTGGSVNGIQLEFNGNVTIATRVAVGINTTLTYTLGTITTTGSTLYLVNNATMNTNGITWNNVDMTSNNPTITINSLFSVSGTFTNSVGGSFQGTSGFTVGTLLISATNAITLTFKDGNTYTVTSSLDCKYSRLISMVTFNSSHASNKAILTLQNGATCACLANFTRIDASGGRPIRSFNGTITDCINIESFHDLLTVAA